MAEIDRPGGHRRSSHGKRCIDCDSSTVIIDNTRNTIIEHDDQKLERERLRRYVCAACSAAWWERVRIQEVTVELIKSRAGGGGG